MPTATDAALMGFWAYSEVHIFGEMSVKLSALQRLPSFDHFTSVTLDLSEPDQRLFHSAADYIRATTVLRKLKIYVFHSAEVAPSSCWTLLFESILANTSISDLDIEGTANFSHAGSFARTVGLSRCITRVSYSRFRSECNPTSFVLSLSEAISDNYNLLEIHLYSYANLGAEAKVLLVHSQGNHPKELWPGRTCWCLQPDYCSRSVRVLAEKEGIRRERNVRDACYEAVSVASKGFHGFMRVTGVVKESVTCLPPADGCSVQLPDLNNDCWRLVRRYLSFHDVKRSSVVETGDATPI
ncbi:hypothetical protein MTO96_032485 [Rhipicephalus appendiculatus]